MRNYFESLNQETERIYNFSYKNKSFVCKAKSLTEAQGFFNQAMFYDGRNRIIANNPEVRCEIPSEEMAA